MARERGTRERRKGAMQWLYGTEQPPALPRRVVLGRLGFDWYGEAIRALSWDGQELVRAVSLVVRDEDWGSYAPTVVDSKLRHGSKEWEIEHFCRIEDHLDGSALLDSRFSVRVEAQSVVVEAVLDARRRISTCRAGITVLHPLHGVVGAPVSVTHADGTVSESRFPELISPCQPFFSIRTLRHAPADDIELRLHFEGDVFEMEDQRNWSDASFKTYNRPLAWPTPYVIEVGDRIEQRLTIEIIERSSGR